MYSVSVVEAIYTIGQVLNAWLRFQDFEEIVFLIIAFITYDIYIYIIYWYYIAF